MTQTHADAAAAHLTDVDAALMTACRDNDRAGNPDGLNLGQLKSRIYEQYQPTYADLMARMADLGARGLVRVYRKQLPRRIGRKAPRRYRLTVLGWLVMATRDQAAADG